jgi:flagellin
MGCASLGANRSDARLRLTDRRPIERRGRALRRRRIDGTTAGRHDGEREKECEMAQSDLGRIRTNIQGLQILQAMRGVNNNVAMHQLRMATGRQINSAGDDPAGLSIATKLASRNKILQQIYDNLGEAKNLLSIGESALGQINDILTEMSAKIERAASDSIGTAERQAIAQELIQMIAEINAVSAETEFNGVKLLAGGTTLTFQTNETSQTVYQTASFSAASLNMTQMAALSSMSVINSNNYLTYLSEVTGARTAVLAGLTELGSLINRFSVKEEVIQVTQINTEAAFSRVMDADLAEEQLNLTKFSILQQSTTAMLAQANLNSQSVLQLLGG